MYEPEVHLLLDVDVLGRYRTNCSNVQAIEMIIICSRRYNDNVSDESYALLGIQKT